MGKSAWTSQWGKRNGPLSVLAALGVAGWLAVVSAHANDEDPAVLAHEVANQGWIVLSAHPAEVDGGRIIQDTAKRGQLDLYLVRPDGRALRNIINTSGYHEIGARFTPDSKHLLYRQLSEDRSVNHDQWGAMGRFVIANADGSNPVVVGQPGEYPWASFDPDMQRIACLYKKEGKIRIFDFATQKMLREMPSQGIFQQIFWSPDGKRLVGTANIRGRNWNIVSLELATRKLTVLTRALNCTPDWFQGDPERVIYSNRNPALFRGQYNDYGLTMLMQATVDGKRRKLIYGNASKHCYYACASPDDRYIVFCDHPGDGFIVGEMRLLRLTDTPIIPRSLKTLKLLYPNSREGPVLSFTLPGGAPLRGFEPHWTYAEIGESR